MSKRKDSINLIRHQEKAVLDKLLDWAFTVGRAIVIITESVALSAFAYRFILDRQIIDLRDTIKQEQAIVALSKTNEDKFRNLQNRLAMIKTLEGKSTQQADLLSQILKTAQGKIAFSAITISTESVSLEGIVPTTSSLAQFVNLLRDLPLVKTVSINSINNKASTGSIEVSLLVTLKKAYEDK